MQETKDAQTSEKIPSSRPITTSISCHTKDVQVFVLRRLKYLRVVKQFNEDESVPNRLLSQFFHNVKRVKTLKNFSLKWSYFPGVHVKPDIVKSVFKHQSRNIREFDIFVLYLILPYHHRNLFVCMKNITTLYLDNNKNDLAKLPTVRTLENLMLDLRYDTVNYANLYKSLHHLGKLKRLHIICLPRSLNNVLTLFDQLSAANRPIEFEVSTEGEQPHSSIPALCETARRSLSRMSFQYIHSAGFIEEFFATLPFPFESLKVLKLDFKFTDQTILNYLSSVSIIPQLETLSLNFLECILKNFSCEFLTSFELPFSLRSFELKMPLLLSKFVDQIDNMADENDIHASKYPWRNFNVFEKQSLLLKFFESFKTTKNLKILTLEFELLESFMSCYTNFFVSILNRVPTLSSVNLFVSSIIPELEFVSERSFDLHLFLMACSHMANLEQIQISMPSLLFEDATVDAALKKLHTFSIAVSETDDTKNLTFSNVNRSIEKMLKTLHESSPHAVNLLLDFVEVVKQEKLVQRLLIIKEFKNLRSFCGKFLLPECHVETAKEIGRTLKSFHKLNSLLIKFLEADKTLIHLKDYIKYHKSIRNMMIHFDKSLWIDNDCLINTLTDDLKGQESDEEEMFSDSEYEEEEEEGGEGQEGEGEEGEGFIDVEGDGFGEADL